MITLFHLAVPRSPDLGHDDTEDDDGTLLTQTLLDDTCKVHRRESDTQSVLSSELLMDSFHLLV